MGIRRKVTQRFVLMGILAIFFPAVPSILARVPLTVLFTDGRLSVSADGVPLRRLLQEVAQRTDVEIRGLERLDGVMSIHFAELPLIEGLRRLLAHANYIIVEQPASRGKVRPVLALVSGQRPLLRHETSGEPVAMAHPDGVADGQSTHEEREERLVTLGQAIQEPGTQGEAMLQEAARDPDPSVKLFALETLAERNPQAAVHALRSATDDPSARFIALQALGRQADDVALLVLAEALTDVDLEVKGYAMQLLAERGTTAALEVLRRAMDDPNATFRQFALEVVSQLNHPVSRSYVEQSLHDGDEDIRHLAADLLRRR